MVQCEDDNMNTTLNQASGKGVESLEKQIMDWGVADEKPGEYKLVRLKFGDAPASDVLSQNQPPFIAEIFRGDGEAKIPVGSFVVPSFNLAWPWARGERCAPADILRRCNKLTGPILDAVKKLTRGKTVIHEVMTGHGEVSLANIEELFLFAYPPAELAAFSFQNEQDRLRGLSEWVLDLLKLEKQERLEKIKVEGQARAVEQLNKFPRRMPHELPEVDHYKNQKEVLDKLLRKEWPRLFAAADKLKAALKLAKPTSEITECQKQCWLAYIADYKSLLGSPPEVRPDERAELWRDENYLRLMADVLNSKKGNVDKRDWRLAYGWITNNYYRMSEAELETAFNNREWKGLHQKGGSLRKRAERIGLITALAPGRRETPNSLPPG
jgi:hypothetical protein